MCTCYGPNIGFQAHTRVMLIFGSNMCIWLKLGRLCKLVMLAICKYKLYEF